MKLTHFSLFSGIGGADLASEWAGFETVGQVEFADYPTKVLEKHWPNVPRWRDIRDVTGDEIKRVTGLGTVTVLSGGFPCQPFSVAGKRKGKDDDRFLWPEMLRVIRELQPTWVIGENVAGFINMGLEDACVDLESEGYAVQVFNIPACGVEAWHERKRVFIVAYSKHNGGDETKEIGKNYGTQQEKQTR
jgi:DNA (cytosine-5)-methyltransferase 1